MPLSMCRIGSTVVVRDLSVEETLAKKLYSMGMIKGALVKVISAEYNGPMTIELLGSQLALGYEIAALIQVENAKYQ